MSEPTVKPIDRLPVEARCFVQWLQNRERGEAVRQIRERLRELHDPGDGYHAQRLWDEVFRELFNQWAKTVAAEIQSEELPEMVKVILGEEAGREPLAAKPGLKERIRKLREKIERVEKEDEEFELDLAEMEKSLSTYEEVLDQFGDDPRLDEVLRRGVKQAVMVKERDFQWFEALLKRLRSAEEADRPEALDP